MIRGQKRPVGNMRGQTLFDLVASNDAYFLLLKVEVLQTLFDWEKRMLLTSVTGGEPAAPLFVACKAGARKCLLFMLEQSYSSTIVNAVNEEGRQIKSTFLIFNVCNPNLNT